MRDHKRVWKLLEYSFMLIFTLKMGAFLILQHGYIFCHQKGTDLEPPSSCSYYHFMELLGSNYRLLRCAAIFPYAYYFFLSVIKHFCDLFVSKKYVPLEENDFYQFLNNPEASERRIRKKLANVLDELIKSSQNYLDSIGRLQDFDLDNQDGVHAASSSWDLTPTRSLEWERAQRSKERRRRLLVLAIRSQCKHLEALKRDLAPIWPLNRQNQGKRDEIFKIAIVCYSLDTLTVWSVSAIIMFFLNSTAFRQHQLESLPVSNIDLLSLVEQQIFTYFCLHWFAEPVGLVVVDQMDQLVYLRLLREKSQKLLDKMAQPKQAGGVRPFWCDHEALELYINFRSFTSELKSCLNLTGLVVSQVVALALSMTLVQLPAFRAMEASEVSLSASSNLMTLMLINILLLGAAAFNARCLRLNKLVWSCIGIPQLESLESNGLELVTPHTLLLWRRLNSDCQQTMQRLNSKLFGTVRISYTFVLQLNFWILSALILVKSTDLLG